MIECGKTKIYVVKKHCNNKGEYDNKSSVSKFNKHLIFGEPLTNEAFKMLCEKDEEACKDFINTKKCQSDIIIYYYCVKDGVIISSARYWYRYHDEIDLCVVYTNPKFRKKGYTHDFCEKTIDDMFNRFGFNRINSSAVSNGGLHLLNGLDFLAHDDTYQFSDEVYVRKYNPKLSNYVKLNQDLMPIMQFVKKLKLNLNDGAAIADVITDDL